MCKCVDNERIENLSKSQSEVNIKRFVTHGGMIGRDLPYLSLPSMLKITTTHKNDHCIDKSQGHFKMMIRINDALSFL